jgi:hypothetical protein
MSKRVALRHGRRAAQPHDYEVPMPPKGDAPSTDSDVTAVAAYVWAIGHAARH